MRTLLALLLLSACDDRPCATYCEENCNSYAHWTCAERFDSYRECILNLTDFERLEPAKKWRCVP